MQTILIFGGSRFIGTELIGQLAKKKIRLKSLREIKWRLIIWKFTSMQN